MKAFNKMKRKKGIFRKKRYITLPVKALIIKDDEVMSNGYLIFMDEEMAFISKSSFDSLRDSMSRYIAMRNVYKGV